MASHFDDTTKWRLSTTAGIPFRYLGLEGEITDENASMVMHVLIKSEDLYAYAAEHLPPAIETVNGTYPQSKTLPGFTNLVARRIKFKTFDPGKPIDPFGFDSSAPQGTYYPVIKAEVEYGPSVKNETSENDPLTFLEVSGSTSGEFLHAQSSKSRWVDLDEESRPAGTYKVNRTPVVPMSILVPTTEWVIRWNQIPFNYFKTKLVDRLRGMLGKVNKENNALLFNAFPGTLLFTGYSYQSNYTWRNGFVNTPPVTLEMRILEKRILWKKKIRGHNDFWRPGEGWQRLLIDGTNPVYEEINYDYLFTGVIDEDDD